MTERCDTPWRSFDEWCDQALIEANYPDVRCIPQIGRLLQGAWNAGRITARSETAAPAVQSAEGRTLAVLHDRLQVALDKMLTSGGLNTNNDQAYAAILDCREIAKELKSPQSCGWACVPQELTAENGAKAALMGEFTFQPWDDQPPITVPWDTIKAIHRKMVGLFGAHSATGAISK